MAEPVEALEVVVRGRTFRVGAPANERAALAAAIASVQARCDGIAAKQTSADAERVLLLAALELAALAAQNGTVPAAVASPETHARLTLIQSKLDNALRAA
jgi:cell division protein ZapA (FtsZ GTPase activity inhibitor)